MPEDQAEVVARAVLGGAGHRLEEVVFELGAGTGGIGIHLAALAGGYVGVDLSWPMLAVFRSRLGTDGSSTRVPLLVHADGQRPWPIRRASVTTVFASRAAHLLDGPHVAAEVRRVVKAGGRFLVGRVEREGVTQILRDRREAMLRERGLGGGGSGRRRTDALLAALAVGEPQRDPVRTVAAWTSTTSADAVLAGWEAMPTMGGETVESRARAELLAELRRWARGEIGDLDRAHDVAERYTLESVRLG